MVLVALSNFFFGTGENLIAAFLPGLAREAYGVILRERAEALRPGLKRELRAWLEAIQRHLEAANRTPDGSSVVR